MESTSYAVRTMDTILPQIGRFVRGPHLMHIAEELARNRHNNAKHVLFILLLKISQTWFRGQNTRKGKWAILAWRCAKTWDPWVAHELQLSWWDPSGPTTSVRNLFWSWTRPRIRESVDLSVLFLCYRSHRVTSMKQMQSNHLDWWGISIITNFWLLKYRDKAEDSRKRTES